MMQMTYMCKACQHPWGTLRPKDLVCQHKYDVFNVKVGDLVKVKAIINHTPTYFIGAVTELVKRGDMILPEVKALTGKYVGNNMVIFGIIMTIDCVITRQEADECILDQVINLSKHLAALSTSIEYLDSLPKSEPHDL